jgi:hypothetical protein
MGLSMIIFRENKLSNNVCAVFDLLILNYTYPYNFDLGQCYYFSFFPCLIFHFQTLTGGLTNLFSSKPKVTEVQATVPVATQPQTGFFGQQQQPAVAPRTQAQPVQQHQQQPYQPQVAAAPIAPAAPAAPVTFDLDKIPGLDDDFEPVPTAPRPGARPSAAGLKPGQKPGEAEGGLLGGLTSGISGLASGGIGGVTGKVGDLTGGAGAALGGGMKAAGGLFKKFGF